MKNLSAIVFWVTWFPKFLELYHMRAHTDVYLIHLFLLLSAHPQIQIVYIFVNCKCAVEAAEELSTPRLPAMSLQIWILECAEASG